MSSFVLADTSNIPVVPLDPGTLKPALNPILVVDGAGLDKLSDFFRRVSVFGWDSETNVVPQFYNRHVRLFQFGDKNEQYVVDLLAFTDGSLNALPSEQGRFGNSIRQLKPVYDVIEPVLNSAAYLKVGMNPEFEYVMGSWNFGIRSWNFYAIDHAERLLYAGLVDPKSPFFSLEHIIARRFHLQISKKEQTSFDLESPLTQEQIIYAALDTRFNMAVKTMQADELTKANLWRALRIENDAIPAFGDMHLHGLYVNPEKWMAIFDSKKQEYKKIIEKLDEGFIPLVGKKLDVTFADLELLICEYEANRTFSQEELEIRQKIKETKGKNDKIALRKVRDQLFSERVAKREDAKSKVTLYRKELKLCEKYEGQARINYASPEQIHVALLKIKGVNKTNLPNTNDTALDKLSLKFPLIETLRTYRELEKHLKNYGVEWTKKTTEDGHVDPFTGHIHSHLWQLGTDTGRPASTTPNVYNIPKDGDVRACFDAPPGHKTGTIDMSGAELRLIAEMSGAKTWISAFDKDWDIHSWSTDILYTEEWKTEALPACAYFTKNKLKCKCPLHKVRRDDTKSANFLLAYKGGPYTLAVKIKKTPSVCMDLMARHKKAFPDVWQWLEDIGKQAKMKLEARTISNRRRLFIRPSWDHAKELCLKDHEEKIKAKLKAEGIKKKDVPVEVPYYPAPYEINKKLAQLYGIIDREGSNTPLQGSNADVAKTAMGCGFDDNGKPFLWHLLEPVYKAWHSNFIYDEFVIWAPDDTIEECMKVTADAILRAGKMFMKKVLMKSEYNIADYWYKG